MIKFFSGKSSPITLLMALQKKGYTSSGSQVECGDESATANKRTIFQGQFGKYKANCYGDGKKSAESKKDFKRRSMALHVPFTTLYVSQPLHPTQRCKSPNFTFIRKTNSIGFDVGLYLRCIQDELLAIGPFAIRKGFWDRHGASNANCYKEMYGGKLIWLPKTIFQRIQRCFAAILSEKD